MSLSLERPIVFFDIESTGLDPVNDRVVEISYIKVFPDQHEESDTIRLNPGIRISEAASRVNGITDEDVQYCPRFADMADALFEVFSGSDIAGFNSNYFDVPMLVEEFARVGKTLDLSQIRLVDVQGIFHKKERRDLSAAYQFYCHKDLENAHTAMADTRATYEVLLAQIERYPDLANNVPFLSEYSCRSRNVDVMGRIVYDDDNDEIVNFGKFKGRKIKELVRTEPRFFDWVQQADFAINTKQTFMRLFLKYKR